MKNASIESSKSDNPKKGSSIFAEGLVTPKTTRRFSSSLTSVKDLTEDGFKNPSLTPIFDPDKTYLSPSEFINSNQLNPSELRTQDRRAAPLWASKSLGEPYYYSEKQLKRKAPRHLTKDFDIPIEGKTPEQQAVAYFNQVETLLQKSDLIINKKGTLNKQEEVEIRLDPKSRLFAAFENKPFYDKNCFISSYQIIPEAVEEFLETGNIGVSPEECKVLKDNDQKAKAKEQRRKANEKSYYPTLSPDARISNPQLRDVEMIQDKLKADPNFVLNDQNKNLLERAQKHKAQKKEFYKNNPYLFDGEL